VRFFFFVSFGGVFPWTTTTTVDGVGFNSQMAKQTHRLRGAFGESPQWVTNGCEVNPERALDCGRHPALWPL